MSRRPEIQSHQVMATPAIRWSGASIEERAAFSEYDTAEIPVQQLHEVYLAAHGDEQLLIAGLGLLSVYREMRDGKLDPGDFIDQSQAWIDMRDQRQQVLDKQGHGNFHLAA